MPYTIPTHYLEFDISVILTLSLIYIGLMCRVSGKLFKELPKGMGRVLSEVFVGTELRTDTILFHSLT